VRRAIGSVLLLLSGCSFGFTGGGLPPSIRTVAVLPFDNNTSDPTLAQRVTVAVKQAVVSRLGLRSAAEAQADAVITGTVQRYDPDQPLAYQGTPTTAGAPSRVDVTRRQVELTVDITVVEKKSGRTLWEGKNQVVQGDYDPGREQVGQKKALDVLVKKVVDGVQQNW